jgi:hypothetical protein
VKPGTFYDLVGIVSTPQAGSDNPVILCGRIAHILRFAIRHNASFFCLDDEDEQIVLDCRVAMDRLAFL